MRPSGQVLAGGHCLQEASRTHVTKCLLVSFLLTKKENIAARRNTELSSFWRLLPPVQMMDFVFHLFIHRDLLFWANKKKKKKIPGCLPWWLAAALGALTLPSLLLSPLTRAAARHNAFWVQSCPKPMLGQHVHSALWQMAARSCFHNNRLVGK